MVFLCNDPATTEIYTLSLHDALPIWAPERAASAAAAPPQPDLPPARRPAPGASGGGAGPEPQPPPDRKSTRLNSSHVRISYAVFCLKKKNISRLILIPAELHAANKAA